jgi:DNA polymerase elongation subunit (family B)
LNEYDKSKEHAHITVAKKMRQTGVIVGVGDVVPYVMCIGRYKAIPTIPDDVVVGEAVLGKN